MPEMPPELHDVFQGMADKVADEMMQAWRNGLCDGLEWAARAVETVTARLAGETSAREILTGIALGIRQAEMSMMLDGLEETANDEG